MTATAETPRQRSAATNERVELARYTITAGERVVYGQRVRGVVRLVDCPASGHGRHYLIERGLTAMSELRALLADYLAESERHDMPAVEVAWLTDDPEPRS